MLTPQTRSLRSKASCRSCCKRWVGGVIELRTAQCDLLAGTTVCLMMPGRNSTPLPRHGRILARAQPSEDQRLYKEGALLEDARSLAELKVENDDELAVAYRGEGEAPAGGRRGGVGQCSMRPTSLRPPTRPPQPSPHLQARLSVVGQMPSREAASLSPTPNWL